MAKPTQSSVTTVAPTRGGAPGWRILRQTTGGPVLLIVDSDRLAADTWSAIFRLHGYRVMTAYDGVRQGFLMSLRERRSGPFDYRL